MKKVAIDTNALLHFRLQREPHFNAIKVLFEQCLEGKVEIFIPEVVFLETEWVLRSYYQQTKDQIIKFFQEILLIENVKLNDRKEMELSLNLYKNSPSVSFTDCLILYQVQISQSDEFLTFDRNLRKLYTDQ